MKPTNAGAGCAHTTRWFVLVKGCPFFMPGGTLTAVATKQKYTPILTVATTARWP